MEIGSKDLSKILDDQRKQIEENFERHVGAIIEHTDSKFEAVLEHSQLVGEKVDRLETRVDGIEKQQEVMFDKIGEIAEDVTIIKETVQDHEQKFNRVQFKK